MRGVWGEEGAQFYRHSQLFVIGLDGFAMAEMLSSADFADGEYKSEKKTMVIFYASWCPFCRRFLSELERILPDVGVPTALTDISDMEDPLWNAFSIDVVPTAILFQNHKPVARLDGVSGVGLRSSEFKAFAEKAIA